MSIKTLNFLSTNISVFISIKFIHFLLADTDFEIHYRDELLDAKFKEHGFRANLEFDTHYDESTICIIRPLTWKYAYVTAPLYEQKEDGKYVKISDLFRGKTTATTLIYFK